MWVETVILAAVTTSLCSDPRTDGWRCYNKCHLHASTRTAVFSSIFFFPPHPFYSFLKPVQSITCWGQPRYPAQAEFLSSPSLSPSLFVLLCHTPNPVKFLADLEGDAGPASSSIQLLFPEPRSCCNHRNRIQRAGSTGGAQKDAETHTRGR